jgi:hypothetical protein
MAEKKDIGDKPSLAAESLRRFVKGAAAGLFSGAVLQPLQVIKTTMQVSPIEKDKFVGRKTHYTDKDTM